MMRSGWYALLIGVAAVSGVQLLRIAVGFAPPLDGTFDGADSYMRLVRVLECRGGVRCPGGLFPRSNAPFGEVLHWPFLEDWLLLAGASVLRPVLAFRDAVIASGYAWGPLLSVLLVAALVSIARRVVSPPALWLVGLVLATQLWVLMGFAPQGVDHHGFIALLVVMAVAAAAPALAGEYGRGRAAIWAGLAMGVGVWVSVETLIASVPLVTALAVQWIARGRTEAARFLGVMFAAAAAVLAVALLVDGPLPRRLAVEYDRFSVVHVVLFALAAAFWIGVAGPRFAAASRVRRFLAAGVGGLAVVALTTLVFPGFVRGPLAEVPADVFATWLSPMVEYVPALDFPPVWPAIALGPLVVALPWCAYRAWRGPEPDRMLWGFLLGALLFFGALAAFKQIRWTYYVHALAPIPLAAALAAALAWLRRGRAPLVAAGAQVALVLLFFSAPLVALVALPRPEAGGQAPCRAPEIVRAVAQLPDEPSVVLVPIFDAPEVLFRTPHDVVATPYHRNVQGSRDSHAIMQATDFAEARRLLAARNIRWIAVCNGIAWSPHVEPDEPGTFYAALQRGDPPEWLRRVAVPTERVSVWEVAGEPSQLSKTTLPTTLPAIPLPRAVRRFSRVHQNLSWSILLEHSARDVGPVRRLTFEPYEKHGAARRGRVSPAPSFAQESLDFSVAVKRNLRIGIDEARGAFAVFRCHLPGRYHGYSVPWDGLTQQMKNALINGGIADRRGRIL